MKDYTIIAPNMLPTHFMLIENVFCLHGYKLKILTNQSRAVIDKGLKYVHNDTCYPALLVIGQMIDALDSKEYDLSKTALMITQTGGGCRASNYIHLLRKALIKAGYENIPVISLNISGLEKNSGFKLTFPLIRQLLVTLIYGDLLMLLKNQTAPYEKTKGASGKLVKVWIDNLTEQFQNKFGLKYNHIEENFNKIVADFDRIEIDKQSKVRVGVVGEIYVKYASLGNNGLEEFLATQDCEVMVPGIIDFMIFKTDNRIEDIKLYGGSSIKKKVISMFYNYLIKLELALIVAVEKSPRYTAPAGYEHLKALASQIIGLGNKMGEGWLLTGEMMELCEQGYENIVCTQPFGCLPNHIVGKGMIRKIKELFPNANIVPIDYDPGATKVNQENRIKLMLAVARKD